MRKLDVGGVAAALLAISLTFAVPAASQSRTDNCAPYDAASRSGAGGSVSVIPPGMLTDPDVALPCLVRLIERLDTRDKRPAFQPQDRAAYMSLTGALRTMITNAIAEDEAAKLRYQAELKKAAEGNLSTDAIKPPPSRLRYFIETYRKFDSTRSASVLVDAVRGDDRAMRSNALLVLVNVVDNTTVCVAIDHLYDKDLLNSDHGTTGRANLLAVISIVAPWAYRETYSNIERVHKYTSARVDDGDGSLKYTSEVLVNIRKRLDRQTDSSNRAVCLPDDERQCYSYRPQKATREQLAYPGPGTGCRPGPAAIDRRDGS